MPLGPAPDAGNLASRVLSYRSEASQTVAARNTRGEESPGSAEQDAG